MKSYGIDMMGRFVLERVASKPTFTASRDKGRLIYDSSENQAYWGSNTQWVSLSPDYATLNNLQAQITSNDNDISNLQTDLSNLEPRVSDNESDISTLGDHGNSHHTSTYVTDSHFTGGTGITYSNGTISVDESDLDLGVTGRFMMDWHSTNVAIDPTFGVPGQGYKHVDMLFYINNSDQTLYYKLSTYVDYHHTTFYTKLYNDTVGDGGTVSTNSELPVDHPEQSLDISALSSGGHGFQIWGKISNPNGPVYISYGSICVER